MNIKFAIPIVIGILAAATLPLGAVLMLIVFCPLFARESRRLRSSRQLTDWHWEHDMVAIRRSILNSRSGTKMSYYKPRRFYGPR